MFSQFALTQINRTVLNIEEHRIGIEVRETDRNAGLRLCDVHHSLYAVLAFRTTLMFHESFSDFVRFDMPRFAQHPADRLLGPPIDFSRRILFPEAAVPDEPLLYFGAVPYVLAVFRRESFGIAEICERQAFGLARCVIFLPSEVVTRCLRKR